MSVIYNGEHSILFVEAKEPSGNLTPTNYTSRRRSWKEFYLVPTSRPSIKTPSPTIALISIPGSNRRLDLTDQLPGGLKFGMRQGQWNFIIDHDRWTTWYGAKATIENYLNGKKLYCILYDDSTVAYRGRFTVTDYQPGADYSEITIGYELEYQTYTNRFNITL